MNAPCRCGCRWRISSAIICISPARISAASMACAAPAPSRSTAAGALLSDARRPGRRRRDRHHRRTARSGRHAASDAAGFSREFRTAMRLLHARHADDRNRAAAGKSASFGARRARSFVGQHLPLHRLPGDRGFGAGRGAGGAGHRKSECRRDVGCTFRQSESGRLAGSCPTKRSRWSKATAASSTTSICRACTT